MNRSREEWLEAYKARGWLLTPLKEKRGFLKDWSSRPADDPEVEAKLAVAESFGLRLGAASKNIFDVDLDCVEASRAAHLILPPTGMRFGRAGRTPSHYFYEIAADFGIVKHKGTDGKSLVELRGNGHQTMVPPSTHPDGGSLTWIEYADPAKVSLVEIQLAVARLAAVSVVARHWPGEGSRHECALALGSALLRAGWPDEDVNTFVQAVCVAALDEEVEDRVRTVESSEQRIRDGQPATGWPRLAELLGEPCVSRFRKFLGITNRTENVVAQGEASDGAAGPDGRDPDLKEREMLVRIAEEARAQGELDVFMTPEALETETFVTFPTALGRRTSPVRSKQFESWLHKKFKQQKGYSPSSNALKEALFSIEVMPDEGDPRHPVFLRVGEIDGTLYVDLCDDQLRAVKIRDGRWEVVAGKEVAARFLRKPGMGALPVPERGGSIDLLRELVHFPEEEMFVLYISTIVSFFHPTGPYPSLALTGEKGSTKSTTSQFARDLVDPNIASLRRPPKELRDMMIAAQNGHVLTFENMDVLSADMSDCIASILTGVGFSTRLLYSDDSEKIFWVCKPAIINSIHAVVTRPDLLERSVVLNLQRLPDGLRREESEIWEHFGRIKAQLLGAILDGVAAAHAGWRKVNLKVKPRMADFATWATAAESAFGWPSGTFMAAYLANADAGQRSAIDASPIGGAILEFVDQVSEWEGTCEQLQSKLQGMPSGGKVQGRSWPGNPRALRAELERIIPSLRAESIEVAFGKRTPNRRRRRILKIRKLPARPSAPSDEPKAA